MNNKPRGRALRIFGGVGIILFASLGSVLAANIAIGNSNAPVEFGQGIFQVKACDGWIQLDLNGGATGQYGAPAGLSALTGITIRGLDVAQCKSTQFKIQAVDLGNRILPIYRTDRKAQMCSVTPVCVIGKSAESDLILNISSKGILTLSPVDTYHSINYSSSTGIFTITFAQPGQLARDISDLLIQSSSV